MKALDIVKTPKGAIGLVTETNNHGETASISFIGPSHREKNAWWHHTELQVLDSLPRVLANATAHAFSPSGRNDVEHFFGESPCL